jgi:hypothetical protein
MPAMTGSACWPERRAHGTVAGREVVTAVPTGNEALGCRNRWDAPISASTVALVTSGPTDGQRRVSRILIYGVTGSGKTTLARRMSALTRLPWHSVDDLTWEPNWVAVPDDEQRRRIGEICAGEEWILDHAYGKWREFARDSIVLWHFQSFRRKRARIRAWSSDPARPEVHGFTSPRQLEDWLRRTPLLPYRDSRRSH